MAKYHDILTAIEQISGEDLSAFRIADSAMKERVLSWENAGTPTSIQVNMSPERYCSNQDLLQKMDSVTLYFKNLQVSSTTLRRET